MFFLVKQKCIDKQNCNYILPGIIKLNSLKMEEVTKLLKEIQYDIKEIKTDLFLIKSIQRTQIEKQEKLEERVFEIEGKLSSINENEMQKNVILYNVEEDAEETSKSIFPKIKEILSKVELDIQDVCIAEVFRIGKKKIIIPGL